MIKIEITDVEKLDADCLYETGKYLMQLGARRNTHKHPSEESHVLNENGEKSPLYKHVEKIMASAVESSSRMKRPVDVQPLSELLEDNTPEIEEELIPVPAEVVEVPDPAEVFAPIPAVPPAPISSVDLDTEGLPWDFRIHARTKTKMKDGSWKKLRGVGPELIKRVEAELKTVQKIPAPPVKSVLDITGLPFPESVPAIPVPPVMPAETAPGFADLMNIVTKAITEGKLKRDQVIEVLKPFGIPSLPLVSTRLDLIPTIISDLNEVINAQ